ncbi:SRPBCC family protein [Microbacterium sp. ISL-59]|uniref:SRPBCC family protein n=1 Tax=Microbacterium sp. ISL-59 TaxID=2819159 RepID=UPI001BE683AA|nr:SRPBCC family protein [Microbacterium sp. ISL-59]MBT2496226.1 SRPBCC family protein [Microbacterium sp. ISL-59]
MATNTRRMRCTPDDVFRVLQDGWLYPVWVVGATRMREVDERWPAPNAELHHTFGTWPLVLDDTTRSVEWAPPHRMRLIARGWPVGEASVTIRVRTDADGCVVRIDEEPRTGPATLIPRFLTNPLLRARNAETLRRLAYIAEGRATQRETDEMNTASSKNDIGTEPSPGPEDHDNLGTVDAEATPPTVPPTSRGHDDGTEVVADERAD